jgi:galactokinase
MVVHAARRRLTRAALAERFRGRFGRPPAHVVRAPGRVNLIGDHTDYNDGFVLPVAIDRATWVAAAPRTDRRLRLVSDQMEGEPLEIDPAADRGGPRGHWSDYPRGVACVLLAAGHALGGADVLVASDLPVGAGLSSSAALEVATALALLACAGLRVEPAALARLCQQAEHDFAGTPCGIMDQLAVVAARAGHAMLLDCRSLAIRQVPLPAAVDVVVCDSGVRHTLADGAYARCRADCAEAARLLGVAALRDVTAAHLDAERDQLPPVLFRRARHVVSENARVLELVEALARDDVERAGRVMLASHASLRDDFAVSRAEIDRLVALTTAVPGVHGSRLTGGGFGGCTVSLAAPDAAALLAERVGADAVFRCAPSAGAHVVV